MPFSVIITFMLYSFQFNLPPSYHNWGRDSHWPWKKSLITYKVQQFRKRKDNEPTSLSTLGGINALKTLCYCRIRWQRYWTKWGILRCQNIGHLAPAPITENAQCSICGNAQNISKGKPKEVSDGSRSISTNKIRINLIVISTPTWPISQLRNTQGPPQRTREDKEPFKDIFDIKVITTGKI